MMKIIVKIFFVVLIFASIAEARTTYNFNSEWKFFIGDLSGAETPAFDDKTWKNITLPRAWNEDEAFKKDIKDLSTSIVWYRKHFKLPANSANKKVFLEFEGIRFAGEFYLNGKFIGRSENGVMAFGFDVSELLVPGENVIAARIDNAWNYKEKATNSGYQWNDKNFNANYGGITKNVFLHVADKIYQTLPLYSNLQTTGTYVYAEDFDIKGKSARITAETEVRNETQTAKNIEYEIAVEDLNGEIVKKFSGGKYMIAPNETKTISASERVSSLNFWSWGYGYLYNVYTILKADGKEIDRVKTRTGFRKTEFANGMFKLNDRTLHLKGYAQRSSNEWVALGASVPAWMSDYSNRMIVESNGNLVRWMHITPWKQDIESCDRVGLLQAVPAGDAEKDVEDRRWGQRVELMRDTVIYNRNNPSVIFWESGNKGISEAHMKEMRAVRDKYDPHGGRAAGSREMLDSKIAEYGGEMLYINKSSRIPLWMMEYSRDESLRKYWDEYSPPFHKDGDGPKYKDQDASTYNRNQDSFAVEDVVRWFDYWEARPGTGERVNAGGVNIVFSDTNTHYRGAENYRRSGEVDAVRLPKDAFYAHQVMWDGWVDVEKPRTHIIGHWNYANSVVKPIYVVSSAEKVELFINGKSKGYGTRSSNFLFTFKDIQWESGEIKAVGYDKSGAKITEDSKKTAGIPVAIRLTSRVSPTGFTANGADIAMIDVEVVDKDGNRCSTALNPINFTLSGEAEWRGGIAQGMDNYILSKTLPVENGVNRVLIRSTNRAGKISLKADAETLKSASIDLVSKPFKTFDGLSFELPNERMPSNLSRGATPIGESFKMSRETQKIVNVTAGSNVDKIQNTYDDNETTDWTSDGKAENAWIKYDLAQNAPINQVVLKLVGWRTQSYPVKISIDDKIIYTGNTPRSLGYVTLDFPPTTGKSVKIELTGNASNRDEFGNIIEIPGTPDQQSSAGKGGAKNTLGIVEVEIYRKL